MKKRNKVLFFIVNILFLVFAVGCEDLEDTYKEFTKDGETIYIGKADSIKTKGGRNRIELSWLLLSDPKVTDYKIYWSNKADSIEGSVVKTAGVDTINVIIEDIAEGDYQFDFYLFDADGNSSIRSSERGSVYGSKYEMTLLNRTYKSLNRDDENLIVEWMPAEDDVVMLELEYKNNLNETIKKQVGNEAILDTLFNFPYGGSFSYRTLFLPEPSAIDTFYASEAKYKEADPGKTMFSKRWHKNAIELGIGDRNITGVAMNDKYLAVQVYNSSIYFYDKNNGEHIKTVPAASSFMMKMDVDDGGRFITARENIYGAGFMVYYYSEETNEHKLLLNYAAGDGCPADLGYEMSVVGNVTEGKAFIYGLAPNDMNIYYWELQDGVLVTPHNAPQKINYGAAGGNWFVAQIQRASVADNSEHFFSYYRPDPADEGNEFAAGKKGSRFHIFSNSMEIQEMNPRNHAYKILDFKVFNVFSDQFVVFNEQNYYAGSNSQVNVFEITDRNLMQITSTDERYGEFHIFKSDLIAPTNYNAWGDVAIHTEPVSQGYDVYIAAATVGFTPAESVLRVYKMRYFTQ